MESVQLQNNQFCCPAPSWCSSDICSGCGTPLSSFLFFFDPRINLCVGLVPCTGPIISCKTISASLNSSGFVTIDLSEAVMVEAPLGKSVISVVGNKTTFGCSDVGTNYVNITATDSDLISNSCVSEVMVAEQITCISFLNLTLNNNGVTPLLNAMNLINSSSGCAINFNLMPSAFSYNCSQIGLNTATISAFDNSGNMVGSCSTEITVSRKRMPSVSCRKNELVQVPLVGSQTISSISLIETFVDDCQFVESSAANLTFSSNSLSSSSIPINVSFIDTAGDSFNCSASVIVVLQDFLQGPTLLTPRQSQLTVNWMVDSERYPLNSLVNLFYLTLSGQRGSITSGESYRTRRYTWIFGSTSAINSYFIEVLMEVNGIIVGGYPIVVQH